LNRAYDWAHEAASSTNLGNLRMPRRSDLAHLAEANPLLLGAVGLGLGMAIATLFPSGLGLRSSGSSRRVSNGAARPAKSPNRRRRRSRARANSAAAS
jgi:hypothetical protein